MTELNLRDRNFLRALKIKARDARATTGGSLGQAYLRLARAAADADAHLARIVLDDPDLIRTCFPEYVPLERRKGTFDDPLI